MSSLCCALIDPLKTKVGRHDRDGRFDELDKLEWLQFEAEERLAADPDNEQAGRDLEGIKKRINELKLDLVIELGRDGLA